MRQHPGGLDREFFAEILPTFAAEYGEHRSLKPGEGEIEVLLSSSETFCFAGVRVGLTFVVLLTGRRRDGRDAAPEHPASDDSTACHDSAGEEGTTRLLGRGHQ
jgi:hypothetical protein